MVLLRYNSDRRSTIRLSGMFAPDKKLSSGGQVFSRGDVLTGLILHPIFLRLVPTELPL